MGVRKGTVKGSSIAKNKNGANKVLMLQVEITDPDDIQSIQLMSQTGEDTRPEDGAEVIILNLGPAYKIAVSSSDNIVPSVEKGEKEFYSTSGGVKKARLKLKKDGLTAIVSPDESIETLMSEFIDTVINIVTTGSPVSQVVNAQSQADLTVIKERFLTLFGSI